MYDWEREIIDIKDVSYSEWLLLKEFIIKNTSKIFITAALFEGVLPIGPITEHYVCVTYDTDDGWMLTQRKSTITLKDFTTKYIKPLIIIL